MSEQAPSLGPDGKPDPTALVQAAIDRLERKIDDKLNALEALANEKFAGVHARQEDAKEHRRVQLETLAQRMDQAERLRVELKADNEKNIGNALAGVEKANEKLEVGITRTLQQMSETAKADVEGLRRDIDALKDRIVDNKERIFGQEQRQVAGREVIAEKREGQAAVYAAVGFGVMLILALITVVGVLAARGGS